MAGEVTNNLLSLARLIEEGREFPNIPQVSKSFLNNLRKAGTVYNKRAAESICREVQTYNDARLQNELSWRSQIVLEEQVYINAIKQELTQRTEVKV